MAGKRGVVFGVANNRSIAWGITKAVTDQGAEVALTYQGDAIKKRVEPLAHEIGSKLVLPCDVTDEATVECVFAAIAKEWGALEGLGQGEAWKRRIRHIPLGRPERAEDVAGIVAFLAGPDSDYMTGQAINVDGGIVMGS